MPEERASLVGFFGLAAEAEERKRKKEAETDWWDYAKRAGLQYFVGAGIQAASDVFIAPVAKSGKTALTNWMTKNQTVKKYNFLVGQSTTDDGMVKFESNNPTRLHSKQLLLDKSATSHTNIEKQGREKFGLNRREAFLNDAAKNLLRSYRERIVAENTSISDDGTKTIRAGFSEKDITDNVLLSIIKTDLTTKREREGGEFKSDFEIHYEHIQNFDREYSEMETITPATERKARIATYVYQGARNRVTDLFNRDLKDKKLNDLATELIKQTIEGKNVFNLDDDQHLLLQSNTNLQILRHLLKESKDVFAAQKLIENPYTRFKVLNAVEDARKPLEDPSSLSARIAQRATVTKTEETTDIKGSTNAGFIGTITTTEDVVTPFGTHITSKTRVDEIWNSKTDPDNRLLVQRLQRTKGNLGAISYRYLNAEGQIKIFEDIAADYKASNDEFYLDGQGNIITFDSPSLTLSQYTDILKRINDLRVDTRYSKEISSRDNEVFKMFIEQYSKSENNIRTLQRAMLTPKRKFINSDTDNSADTKEFFNSEGFFKIEYFIDGDGNVRMDQISPEFIARAEEIGKANDVKKYVQDLQSDYVDIKQAMDETTNAYETFKKVFLLLNPIDLTRREVVGDFTEATTDFDLAPAYTSIRHSRSKNLLDKQTK